MQKHRRHGVAGLVELAQPADFADQFLNGTITGIEAQDEGLGSIGGKVKREGVDIAFPTAGDEFKIGYCDTWVVTHEVLLETIGEGG